ncbi:hypothetical protein ACRCPS_18255 [Pseudomonas aeruginosa]
MSITPFNTLLVVDLFALFRNIEMELPLRGKDGQAVKVVHSLLTLYSAIADQPEADRVAALKGLAQVVCPLKANGVGDSIIWRGLRKAQLTTLSNQYTNLTNQIRAELHRVAEMESVGPQALQARIAEVKCLKTTCGNLYGEKRYQSALETLVGEHAGRATSLGMKDNPDDQFSFLLAQGFTPAQIQENLVERL